jgi:hypothetical protein
LDQTSKPTYYDPFSIQMYAKIKLKVKEPPKFVVSFEPRVLLVQNQAHPLQQGCQE